MTLRLAAIAAALLAVLLTPASALANCGAEGCPLAPRGPESAASRYSFRVGYQTLEQDRHWDGSHEISAAEALAEEGGFGHVVEQETRTRLTLFEADARLTRRLSLTVSLPYVDRVHRHALAHHTNFFIPSEWHMQGAGDATTLASWDVLDRSRMGATSLTLQLGAKLPTGRTDVDEVDGEAPEASARPGTGSTDALAGLHVRRLTRLPAALHLGAALPVTASVTTRVNGKGTDGYRMGNSWDASVGTSYPLGTHVRLLAQLNATAHGRDEVGDTDAEPHHTGSTALYASPGALVSVVPGMTLFGYYQAPLAVHTNGPQLVSGHHLSIGVVYSAR